jgi:hypothetical protein
VLKTLNTKVVDLAIIYNFHKGHLVFSQQILYNRLANFECQLVSVNRRSVDQVFHLFHSKFEMPIYMKVASLNKLDNFHKGRFLSV